MSMARLHILQGGGEGSRTQGGAGYWRAYLWQFKILFSPLFCVFEMFCNKNAIRGSRSETLGNPSGSSHLNSCQKLWVFKDQCSPSFICEENSVSRKSCFSNLEQSWGGGGGLVSPSPPSLLLPSSPLGRITAPGSGPRKQTWQMWPHVTCPCDFLAGDSEGLSSFSFPRADLKGRKRLLLRDMHRKSQLRTA